MKVDKGSSVCTYYGKSRVYENIFDSIALGSGLWLAIYGYGMYWEDRFLWVLILSYALFMILAEFNEVYVNNNPSSILRKVPLVLLCWVAVILSFMLINLLFKTGINMPPSVFIFWCIIFYNYLSQRGK